MAKGRKHGLFHRERLLGSFSHGHGHPTPADDLPDLGEEDIWSAMAADEDGGEEETSGEEGWYGDSVWRTSGGGGGGGGSTRAHDRRAVGGLSLAFEGSGGGAPPRVVHQCRNADSSAPWGGGGVGDRRRHQAASAPVSVPGWPGAPRADAAGSPPADAELDDGEWLPPHEYLAREHSAAGSNRGAAGSVFEGVGRTLKGRDLRRLRDAVWSQTGFYG